MRSERPRRVIVLPLAIALSTGALLAACGDDDPATTAATTTTTAAKQAAIAVTGAWARTSAGVANAGAVYFEMTNNSGTDDALVAASVDPAVAKTAELHETKMADGDAGSSMSSGSSMSPDSSMPSDSSTAADSGMTPTTAMGATTTMGGAGTGMMSMQEVERIPVAAGATVMLKPGSYHVMLMELAKPLTAGEKLTLTLTFQQAGTVTVEAEVRDSAP